ncbi:hypothetical protein C8J55DRAFT_532652 [Lentinula edodes]|uniref:T-complex protein 1 subunit delta n=1 Tax=Lentinula lateritia TaxID=40482 RepID=A0A9W9E1Z8_9AGAR|nr:hypothetical protein C8J55DRAFT_532652 [Lentinula edodes]
MDKKSFLVLGSLDHQSNEERMIAVSSESILSRSYAANPAAKMPTAEDMEVGDGMTSVVVLAGSFLGAAEKMLQKGIHPTLVAESFLKATIKAMEYLTDITAPVDLNNKPSLLLAGRAHLSISRYYSSTLAPIIVAAVTHLVTPTSLNKISGTIEDAELLVVEGVVQELYSIRTLLLQLVEKELPLHNSNYLSAPKLDMDSTIIINDYRQMDKVIKEGQQEGQQYLLNVCKKIKKANSNILLLQNIFFPIVDIETFTEDKLGYADIVEETSADEVKIMKITGIEIRGQTVSIMATGSNNLVVEECERSLHDALCIMALIGSGGAPEIHASRMLSQYAQSLKGMEAYCFQAYADALEVIPGLISNILGEDVQPLLVSTSAVELATKTVCLLLKIDNYLQSQ